MTDFEKEKIRIMRIIGRSYSDIAGKLGLNTAAVRSYCNRSHLSEEELQKNSECLHCGKRFPQTGRGKRKIYCSEKCRSAWRRATNLYSDTRYHHVCKMCGKHFETQGNKSQQFCSRECYRKYRKGDAA